MADPSVSENVHVSTGNDNLETNMEDISPTTFITSAPNNYTSGPVIDEKIFFDIASALWKGGTTVGLFIGGLLNILIIIIFSRKTLKGSVTSVLFRLLAIADTIFILSHPLAAFLWFNFEIHTFTLNLTSCKIFITLNNSSKYSSAWLLVFIGFERVIAILFPHKIAILVKRKNALIAVAIAVSTGLAIAISSVTNIQLTVQYNSEGEIIQKFCTNEPVNAPKLYYYVVSVWPFIDFSYYTGEFFFMMHT